MRQINQTPYDVKQTLKVGLVYLLIAFPFVLVVATILTILKAPLWLIMVCNIAVGGAVVLIAFAIHTKIKQKKQEEKKSNFDPFRD